MIPIEGPHDITNVDPRNNPYGFLLVKGYDENPGLAFSVDMAFSESPSNLDRDSGILHTHYPVLERRLFGEEGRLRMLGLEKAGVVEMVSLERLNELSKDPEYQSARAFQIDPSDTIYREFDNMHPLFKNNFPLE